MPPTATLAVGRRATPAAPLVAPGGVGPRPVAPMGSPGAHREGVCVTPVLADVLERLPCVCVCVCDLYF